MTHTAVMRATSLVASAGLLTFACLAALTLSYTVARLTPPVQPPPIIVLAPEPQPPAPPEPKPATHHDASTSETATTPTSTTPPADTSAPTNTTQTSDIGPALVTDPHWLQRPRELTRYYPQRAISRGAEGNVDLDCLVSVTGQLNCTVISETPGGWGFATAALRISRDYRMVPAYRNGAPVQGRYRMRVPFRLGR